MAQLEQPLAFDDLFRLNELMRKNSPAFGVTYKHPLVRKKQLEHAYQRIYYDPENHPGYTAFWNQVARNVIALYENPETRPAHNSNLRIAREFLANQSNDSEALRRIAPASVSTFRGLLPYLDDEAKFGLMRYPFVFDQSAWFLNSVYFPARKEKIWKLHRYDLNEKRFEEVALPERFQTSLFSKLMLAETEDFVLINQGSNADEGAVEDIFLYNKANGEWQKLGNWLGAGDGSAHALKDGRFLLLGKPARQADKEERLVREREYMVLRLDPGTLEVEILAHNMRTPAKYPFERPTRAFTQLLMTLDGEAYRVAALGPDNGVGWPRGKVSLVTGEYTADKTSRPWDPYRSRYRPVLNGVRGSSPYRTGKNIRFHFRNESTRKTIQVEVDVEALNDLMIQSGIPDKMQEAFRKDLDEERVSRRPIQLGDQVILYTPEVVVFFEKKEIDKILTELLP